MRFVLDTHAHTLVSGHAYNTIKEMAFTAKEKDLEAIALTEHAPNLPWAPGLYYFDNLKVVPREMFGVKLLLGVELNILDEFGTVDLPESVYSELDIVIASIHIPDDCYGISRGISKNTQAYLKTIEKPGINIIGHPDDIRFPVDYDMIVAAAKEHHVLLELNNSSINPDGVRKGSRENQIKLIETCKKYKADVSLGSDAHVDIDLANFKRTELLLETYDFPEELIVNTSLEKLLGYVNCGKNK
ncbi:MAG: phosphatase [Eubacteriales bacterium]